MHNFNAFSHGSFEVQFIPNCAHIIWSPPTFLADTEGNMARFRALKVRESFVSNSGKNGRNWKCRAVPFGKAEDRVGASILPPQNEPLTEEAIKSFLDECINGG